MDVRVSFEMLSVWRQNPSVLEETERSKWGSESGGVDK